jgi:hypothetical protein
MSQRGNLPIAPPSRRQAPSGTFTVRAPDGTEYEVQAPAGATEAEIMAKVQEQHAKEATRMSPQDEAGYIALAKNPDTTADQLVAYAASKGFGLAPEAAQAFVEQRSAAGGKAGDAVSYTDDPVLPPEELSAPPGPGDDPNAPAEQEPYDPAQDPHRVLVSGTHAAPNLQNSTLDNIRGGMGRFLNGAFPGSARSIAGFRGVVDNTVSSALGRSKFDPSAAYGDYAGESDREIANFSRDHSNMGDTLGWGGFGTSMFLPAAKVAKGNSLRAATANGIATGATYGTVGGLLNDSGDGRLANAENGLLFGGALGGVLPGAFRLGGATGSLARRSVPFVDPAMTALGNAARRVRGLPTPPPNLAARAQAERLVGQEMNNGHISQGMGVNGPQAIPANVEAEVARRQAQGVPAIPADTFEDGRRLLSWAVQGRGPMTTRARSLLNNRQAGAGGRVRQHVQAELGPAVDPIAEARAISERASAAAGPAYEAAYAAGSPMVIDQNLGSIMQRPAFQRSLPQAFENIQNRGGDPTDLGFRVLENGNISLTEEPSFEAFDQVLRTMNKSIPRDALGRPVLDNVSGGIQDAAGALDTHLKTMNEPYRDVKAQFADEMGIKTAMDRGGQIASATGPEINDQLGRITQPHAREAWTAGARTALADVATDKSLKPTANVPQQVRQAMGLSGAGLNAAGGDAAKLQAIETMSNRPGVVHRLDDRLEGEDQAFKTFSEAFGNSKTAGRQAFDQALSGDSVAIAAKAISGRVIGATMDLLASRGAGRSKQDVQERIAEVLTASQPQDVVQAMAAIRQRAESDQAFRSSLDRAGMNLGRIASGQGAALPAETPVDPNDLPPPPAIPGYGPRTY